MNFEKFFLDIKRAGYFDDEVIREIASDINKNLIDKVKSQENEIQKNTLSILKKKINLKEILNQ